MQKHPRILLALDGSDQSLVAVRYISKVISKQAQTVLLHVAAEIPEAFRDMNVDRSTGQVEYLLEVWKDHQNEIVNEFMAKARAILVYAGFSREAVTVKTQPLKSGIVRDIVDESHQDYSALVVGRTGVSKIDQIRMGSVASKLVEVAGHIPLIVVGESPESQKILIALDGSRGSMRAVNCVGTLLDPAVCEIMLCHVVRPLSNQQLSTKELFMQKHEADWIAISQRKILPAINEAKRHLVQAGFSEEEHISIEILTYQKSRAAAIAKTASDGAYRTIVLGRRGLTSAREFNLGRVSRKILHFAFQPALWIVN